MSLLLHPLPVVRILVSLIVGGNRKSLRAQSGSPSFYQMRQVLSHLATQALARKVVRKNGYAIVDQGLLHSEVGLSLLRILPRELLPDVCVAIMADPGIRQMRLIDRDHASPSPDELAVNNAYWQERVHATGYLLQRRGARASMVDGSGDLDAVGKRVAREIMSVE